MKHKYKIFPTHSIVENDEYFYRHPEMYRSKVEDDVFDTNDVIIENNRKNIVNKSNKQS